MTTAKRKGNILEEIISPRMICPWILSSSVCQCTHHIILWLQKLMMWTKSTVFWKLVLAHTSLIYPCWWLAATLSKEKHTAVWSVAQTLSHQ